jgi:serine/threonine protein kinase
MGGAIEPATALCPNCGAGQISPLTHRCELCGFAPGASALDDLARRELAEEFRLGALLGRGKGTAVFVARTHESEREIAVKVLPRPLRQRSDADERFKRAVEAVAVLEHPHIVPVFDHGWTEHLYWYSMDRVRGRSLRNYLEERAPLDLKACLRVTAQVASALDHAHRRGVVHGFLKPENVLIDAEGWVHLCDLLVTRALEPPPAAAPPPPPPSLEAGDDAPVPPPVVRPSEEDRSPYSAPEGLCTPSADQYALAVMVTECLSGTPQTEAVLAGAPPHVRNAVERALSPMPMDRFGGVLEFVAALETFTTPALEARPAGRSSGILRLSDYKAPPRPGRKRLIRVGAAAVALMAIVAWQRSTVLRLLHRGGAPTQLVPVVTTATDSEPRVARLRAEALRQSGRVGIGLPPARPVPPPTPASTEPGKLFVNATPWGQLYIDGQLAGNTPKANLPLAVGLHAIRVLREGYEPFDRIVRVEAGQTVRLTDITLVQRP